MRLAQSRLISTFLGLVLGLSTLVFCAGVKAEALRPFKLGSLSEITAQRAGKPFILLFWSLDCPC